MGIAWKKLWGWYGRSYGDGMEGIGRYGWNGREGMDGIPCKDTNFL